MVVPSTDALLELLDHQLVPGRLQALWLFGSHARGTARPDSDLDLGVLASPALGLDRARIGDICSSALDCEIDLVDLSTTDPILAWEVVTSGKLLAERDAVAVQQFARRARFAAEDADQRNRMILLAVGGRR